MYNIREMGAWILSRFIPLTKTRIIFIHFDFKVEEGGVYDHNGSKESHPVLQTLGKILEKI